jgi:hypothetical protein
MSRAYFMLLFSEQCISSVFVEWAGYNFSFCRMCGVQLQILSNEQSKYQAFVESAVHIFGFCRISRIEI